MWLSLSLNEAELILSLCDNGIGFELDNIAQHTSFGLDGIRNRVMSLDGKVEFKNDQGAVIEAVFYGVTTQ